MKHVFLALIAVFGGLLFAYSELNAQQPMPSSPDVAVLQSVLPLVRQSPTSVVVGDLRLERRRPAIDKATVVIVPTRHGDSIVSLADVDVYFTGAGADAKTPAVLVYNRTVDSLYFFANGLDDATTPIPMSCGVSDHDVPPVAPPVALDPIVLANKPLLQLDLAVESDDEFYKNVGGTVEKAQAYLAALYTVVSALYEDEIHVTIHLSSVRIWTGNPADPYQAKGDPFKLRDAMGPYWKNNYNTVKRDVFQGLTASTWGGGGFGYFDGLCGKNGDFGFSTASVKGTDVLPSFGFVYDVYIVAHELGHNFNAVHTHDCYWAPPIDTCIAADGISGGCLPAGQKPLPNAGSIMSYCANTNLDAGRGYSMRMTFLPRVIALMRQTAEAATCLQGPPTPTVRLVSPRGQELLKASDTTSIRWRASSDVGKVNISYTINAGKTWETIAMFVDADDELFVWTIPQICSNRMLVRVAMSTDPGIADTSITTFSIQQDADPTGLVAWYPFNSTTNDSASCGYYPLTGAAVYGNDRSNTSGRAAMFNGSTVLRAPNFVADFTTFTSTFWFKLNDVGGVQTFVGQNWEEGPSFYVYSWEGTLGAAIYFVGEGVPFQIWGSALTPGTWYHAAVVYNGNNALIYLNGEQVSAVPKTGVLLKNTTPLYVGARKNTEYVRGAMDDVRIYRRALNAAEVSALAAETAAPPSAPTLQEPLHMATGVATPVTLRWMPATDVTLYRLELSRSSNFTSTTTIVYQAIGTETTYPTNVLLPSTTYYWRVRASNAAGWSDWSQTWWFTTATASSVTEEARAEKLDFEEIVDQLGRLVLSSKDGAVDRDVLNSGMYISLQHRGSQVHSSTFVILR